MSFWIGLAIGLFAGAGIGVLLGGVMAAAHLGDVLREERQAAASRERQAV